MTNFKAKNQPLFSIIIPFYNAENTIIDCIQSVLSQKFLNYEVLLIDDGSIDNSFTLCTKFLRKNIFLYQKKHGGLVSTRNYGLSKAKGKWVVYVDADDVIYDNYLSSLFTIINKYKNIDMITFNYDNTSNVVPEKFKSRNGYYNKKQLKESVYPWIFDMNFNMPAWRSAYKYSLLIKHYCKDESIITGEDFAFTYECLFYADSFFYLNKSLYQYNDPNININKNLTSSYSLDAIGISKLGEYLLNNLCSHNNKIINSSVLSYINYHIIINIKTSAVKHTKYGLSVKANVPKYSYIKISNNWKQNEQVKFDVLSKEIMNSCKLTLNNKIINHLLSKKLYFCCLLFVRMCTYIK